MTFTQPESVDYQSYLLRLWRDGPQRPWRASLHCVATDTLHHFADMTYLLAFLQAQTGDVNGQTADEPT